MNDQRKDKIAGVLGGMGPDATVDFMQEVLAVTDAGSDQEHLHMIVDCNPQVPDRQAAIRGEGGDVGGALADMARRLAGAGAEVLVMPCNTAHVFAASISEAVSLPFIDIIKVTVDEIAHCCPQARAVGVLATTGCLETGIYQDALESAGYDVLVPEAVDDLMQTIFEVKSGDKGPGVRTAMAAQASALVAAGADVIVAGCTEIPLVLDEDSIDVPLISSTAVLARKTVEYCKTQ